MWQVVAPRGEVEANVSYKGGVGLLSAGLAKAYERQRNAIYEEAAALGGQVIGYEEHAEGLKASRLLGDALKDKLNPFGGSMRVDGMQIFGFETGGVQHLYVQPWSQMHALPGEHHAWLPGAYRSPVVHQRAVVMGMSWNAGGDAELAKWLGTQAALMQVVKGCKKDWKAGTKTFDLEWTVQLLSLGDGRSHLIMQAGRYGGLTSYRVGLGHFLSLGHAWAPLIGRDTQYPAHAALQPVSYSDVFYQYVLQASGSAAPPAPAPPASPVESNYVAAPTPQTPQASGRDYAALIARVAGDYQSETLFVGHYPADVEANVRALVLPPHQKSAPIALIHDLTVMGSGKDAVVLTPSYLYVRELGEQRGFGLEEIVSVDAPKGMLGKSVKVHLPHGRSVKVPCANGPDANTIAAVLDAIARA